MVVIAFSQFQQAVTAQSDSIGGGTFFTVSGNILADGLPVAEANVVLLIGSSIVESTMSDASGNYVLNAIGGNSYTASVYKEGFNFDRPSRFLDR